MSDEKFAFVASKKEKLEVLTCLGLGFSSDDERREYFRNELRKKLPELKKTEGFPIGEDEDIIALSDPPYYTTCPNPWLNDFIEEWEKEKEKISGRKRNFKVDEPYASDVSEGKNNPIYNAHSYHTKVPHPAIMRYILHYTQPGDIIFDGFAGTGMTGVAAQMCNNPDLETKTKIEEEWKKSGFDKPNWGIRKAILGDLSPIASFIAYNYNTPTDVEEFEKKANVILNEVEAEYGWMYNTIHTHIKLYDKTVEEVSSQLKKLKTVEDARKLINEQIMVFGRINYTVWSDVFICAECGSEIVFWEVAVNHKTGEVKDEFKCSNCKSVQTKRSLDKAWVTIYDKALGNTIKQTKTVPVIINYSIGSKKFEKRLDLFDLELIKFIDKIEIPNWYPKDALPNGYNTQQPIKSHGNTHVHHFYTKRNLYVISLLKEKSPGNQFQLLINSQLINISKLNRHRPNVSFPYNPLNGTLYIGSQTSEAIVFTAYENKITKLVKAFSNIVSSQIVNVRSAESYSHIKNNSVDYIFTDPPFGGNIMYSELNYIWESWLKVKTNNKKEAIENNTQNKGFLEYQELMLQCFIEYYRVLKSGKWMTVEFSNTSAAIWNGIQTALQRAGFVVANVAALDKQQGSFKAVTTTTAVKQDLIISCYKPSAEFENKFKIDSIEINIWDFIKEHLQHLPIQIKNLEKRIGVVERSPRILFDRLITFYLMRGMSIPVDAADFQAGLKQKFLERDGMFFTAEQAAEYEELNEERKGEQYTLVFDSIYSESDAVLWLRERLQKSHQTYQEIMPDFRKANRVNRKGEFVAELKTILEENFIQESNGKWRVPNMNEAKDREALRNKSLLKEFDKYRLELDNPKTKKIKEVRVEALRAGFKRCWEKKDFKTIVNLGDKIPQNILLEDEQLLMYYDIAKDRI